LVRELLTRSLSFRTIPARVSVTNAGRIRGVLGVDGEPSSSYRMAHVGFLMPGPLRDEVDGEGLSMDDVDYQAVT
jgi:hypothetical protein